MQPRARSLAPRTNDAARNNRPSLYPPHYDRLINPRHIRCPYLYWPLLTEVAPLALAFTLTPTEKSASGDDMGTETARRGIQATSEIICVE